MIGSTGGIIVAFAVALIFLARERRLLRRAAEDDEDDEDERYWRGYRSNYR
jgi:hypothetical protein